MENYFVKRMELRPTNLNYDEVRALWRKVNRGKHYGRDYGFPSAYVYGGIFLFTNKYAVLCGSACNVPTMWLGHWESDGTIIFGDFGTGRCPGDMESHILKQVSIGDVSFWK